MDLSTYATEKIAEMRLADLRAATARAALIESAGLPRRGLGHALGSVLIRVGRWLAPGDAVAAPNGGVRVAR